MRTLIKVVFDTETSNRMLADGSLQQALQGFMSTVRPEAAYFAPTDGRRCAYLFADLPEEAALVTSLEPFWQLNAHVTVTPCMNAEDLTTGLGRISDSG
ncbi:hypothetical protein ACIRBX_15980 [Kitasatospora sp. NPDC096147]|uniref:hypothetical protein n=1 Tax=Kitasatospora sp. NPDC096147 TaxID=3364093 RepID=UPI0038119CFA